MMRKRGASAVASVTVSILLTACGGQASPPAASAEPAPVAPPPSAEPAAAKPEPVAPAPAAASSSESPPAAPEQKDAAGSPESGDSSAARNVRYMVSPDGMRVEVEGLALTPKAEAVKSGAGFGIKLRVEARAKDDDAHIVLAPKGSELAFAGTIHRSGQSEPEKFGDERKGDQQVTIKGNKSVTITRSWPATGGPKPLATGDEAEFMVGLWGVGSNPDALRPLKKFCKITVKLDKAKPRVVVGPPDGVGR